MTQLAGTTNLDSLNLAANLVVGGTASVAGAAAITGAVTLGSSLTVAGTATFTGPVNSSAGGLMPGTLFGAAGTVTLTSGIVAFNASVAGFAVRLPAPQIGAQFMIINQIVASSGNNTITIPAGGTIYQGTVAGSVLTYATVGQTSWLVGISSTQYRSMLPGTTSAALS